MLIPQSAREIMLEFDPVGMDAQFAWPISLTESLHWRVSVEAGDRLKYDLSSLTPAEASCRR